MVVCCLAVLQIYLCLYLLFILQENYKVLINFWEVILKNFYDSLQKKSEVLYASLVRSTVKVSRHSSQFMHFFFLKNALLLLSESFKTLYQFIVFSKHQQSPFLKHNFSQRFKAKIPRYIGCVFFEIVPVLGHITNSFSGATAAEFNQKHWNIFTQNSAKQWLFMRLGFKDPMTITGCSKQV